MQTLNLQRRSLLVSWDQFKSLITRNWREKLVALLLACLFWYMIKSQISGGSRYAEPLPPLRAV